MSTVKACILGLTLVACVAPGHLVSAPEAPPRAVAAPKQDEVAKAISAFLSAPVADKYKMLTQSYRNKLESGEHLEVVFSKEGYELARIDEATRYEGKPMMYVRAQVRWGFEGFEGDQTCHFIMALNGRAWLFDFILC